MKTARFCAASNVRFEPRDQAHEYSGRKSRLQADLIPLRGTDWLELNATPVELPALDQNPFNIKEPAIGAGYDYNMFIAARK